MVPKEILYQLCIFIYYNTLVSELLFYVPTHSIITRRTPDVYFKITKEWEFNNDEQNLLFGWFSSPQLFPPNWKFCWEVSYYTLVKDDDPDYSKGHVVVDPLMEHLGETHDIDPIYIEEGAEDSSLCLSIAPTHEDVKKMCLMVKQSKFETEEYSGSLWTRVTYKSLTPRDVLILNMTLKHPLKIDTD